MNIEFSISSAKHQYRAGNYSEALCLVCNAIDTFTVNKYPRLETTERYEQFIKDNFITISEFGFPGIITNNVKIKVNFKAKNIKPNQNGYVDMHQIMYYVLKCGLLNSFEIENNIEFTKKSIVGDWDDNKFLLPNSIICGFIAAIEKNNI